MINELSDWARKLALSDLPELRAAGRAILALLEDNERLRSELHARAEADEELEDAEVELDHSLADSLRARLRRRRP